MMTMMVVMETFSEYQLCASPVLNVFRTLSHLIF